MKKVLSIILAAVMMLAVLPMAVFAEGEEPPVIVEPSVTAIDKIEIDFVYPVIGEAASEEYLLDTEGCAVVEAQWFAEEIDDFIEEGTTFSAGKYYITVTLSAEEGFEFSEEINVVINGNDAVNVDTNEDGTVTAVAAFELVEQEEQPSIFARLFEALRIVFLTVVRFFGEMVGLK